jgi:hypothetical protein
MNKSIRKMILNWKELIVKLKLKGLPSEVAKRMTFEEQFALTDKAPTSSKSHPHFTLGGLRPESRGEIP